MKSGSNINKAREGDRAPAELFQILQDDSVKVLHSICQYPTGEGNGKPLQHCLENPINSMKRQKGMTLKDEPPGSIGVQYAPREDQGNSSKKNEEAKPKRK